MNPCKTLAEAGVEMCKFVFFFKQTGDVSTLARMKCRAMVKPSEVAMVTFTHRMEMLKDRWLPAAAAQCHAKVNSKHS